MSPIIFDHLTKFKVDEDKWRELKYPEKMKSHTTGILVGGPKQQRMFVSTDDGDNCYCKHSWKPTKENPSNLVDKHGRKLKLKDVCKSVRDLKFSSTKIVKKWQLPDIEESPVDHRYALWAAVEFSDWVNGFEFQYDSLEDMNILYYDIEVETKGDGIFPRPERNPIYAIGYAINDQPIQILDAHPEKNKGKSDMDRDIVREFFQILRDEKIDVIVGFNSLRFDNPYIIRRALDLGIEKHHIPAQIFTDVQKAKSFYLDSFYNIMNHNINDLLLGYILYDIYSVSVVNDQSLMDLKDRKLKTLAEHYKINYENNKAIKLEFDQIRNLENMVSTASGKDSFLHYLESDVSITRDLANKIYFQQEKVASDMLSVPLNSLMYRDRGTIPSISLEREYREAGIFPATTNMQRRFNLYDQSKGKPYQGAIVEIFKYGFFERTWKLDYSGMYPGSMRTLNLSPDTVDYFDDDECPEWGYRDHRSYELYPDKNGDIIFKIPDENQGKRIHLRIKQNKEGIATRAVRKAVEARKQWKQKAAEYEGRPEESLYSSYSSFHKVVANSVYGIMGNKGSVVGDIAVALAITGFCRYLTLKTIDFIGKENIIEIDTDGFIISKAISADEINAKIDHFVRSECGLKQNFMTMDFEEFGKAYFYATKNYVLEKPKRNENGDIVSYSYLKHGVTLKSSNSAAIKDRAIDIMADHVLNQNGTFEEASKNAHEIQDLPIDNFIISLRIKHMREYGKGLAQSHVHHLANQFEKATGYRIQSNDSIEFVYDRNEPTGVTIAMNASKNNLNWDKYHEVVNSVVKVFSESEKQKRSVFGRLAQRNK